MRKLKISLLVCFFIISCHQNTQDDERIAVTGVSLNKLELVIANIGATKTLIATVEPSDASNAAVEWSIDNPAVATVSATGEVTAVGEGTAVITAKTADGGKTATCVVTIVGCCLCDILDPCIVDPKREWERPVKPGYWDYPVKPDTPEWANFDSYTEMVAACQIPEEILLSVSTEELTDIVLRYPLIADPMLWNSLTRGLNALYDNFNGIRELFKREDAAKELLKHYNCMIQEIDSFGDATDYTSFLYGANAQIVKYLLGFFVQKSDILLPKEEYKRMLQCTRC